MQENVSPMDIAERRVLEATQTDTINSPAQRHRYAFAARLVEGQRVLDVCCDSGYGSAILATSATSVTGIDLDAATVETASMTARKPNLRFEIAAAAEYLERDIAARFDVLVWFDSLAELRDRARVLSLLGDVANRGVRIIASLPDNDTAAFSGFPSVVVLPQFSAKGSVIWPSADGEVTVDLGQHQAAQPAQFIFCVGFDDETLRRAHSGNTQVQASPVSNRDTKEFRLAASALRRENARLGRARLGKAGSAAASALASVDGHDAQIAALRQRCDAAEARAAELERSLRHAGDGAVTNSPLTLAARLEAVEALPVSPEGDDDPDSWNHGFHRSRAILVPWIEQTVSLEGKTVLDYGCGNAAVSCAVAQRALRVIGMDVSEDRIQEAHRHVREQGLSNVELERHQPEKIIDAARSRQGHVDVLLLCAVLEHLTVADRLRVLRLGRELVEPGGVIVVCETPNRLTYLDPSAERMPFFHLLPDELAAEYYASPLRAPISGRDAIRRWGRGVSFHEFEIVFEGRLDRRVIASNYDPLLFGERPVNPEEVSLARYLSRTHPDLAPVWSRCRLDLILSVSPVDDPPPMLRPWTAETTDSHAVAWTAWENLLLEAPDASAWITLPRPTRRVVVGTLTLDGRWLSIYLRPEHSERSLVSAHKAAAQVPAFTTFALDEPTQRLELSANDACEVVFVGYEA